MADRLLGGLFLNQFKPRLSAKSREFLKDRRVRIRPADKGLKVDVTGELIPPEYSPAMRDILFYKNEIRKAYGGTQLGATFDEELVWVGIWKKSDGLIIPIAITSKNLLYYRNNIWNIVPPEDGLDGTAKDLVSVSIMDDTFFFTCRQYSLRAWTGDTSALHYEVTAGVAAKGLDTINNRLVLAHTIEKGEDLAQTIRWTQNGLVNFTGTGSGNRDLADRDDAIQNIKKLGPFRGLIYKSESIVDIRATGDVFNPFDTTELVGQLGLLLSHSLAEWRGGHFFTGNDENIYYFDGSKFDPIGNDVKEEIFANLNPNGHDRAIGTFDLITREYILAIPTGTSSASTAPSLYYAYDVVRRRWRSGQYPNITCFGQYKTVQGISWDEDVGSWNEAIDTWNDETGIFSRLQTIVGTSTKKTFLLDSSSTIFDGNQLQFSWESFDAVGENDGDEITLLEVIVGYIVEGTATLSLSTSIDRGNSFSTALPISLGGTTLTTGDIQYAHGFPLVTGDNIRIRLQNSTSGEKFRIISVTLRFSGTHSSRVENVK